MQSKNKRTTTAERIHLAAIKQLPCSVCNAPGPSVAHHIDQSTAWTCVALCDDCHRDFHGLKNLWRVYKMDELDALAKTIERLMES